MRVVTTKHDYLSSGHSAFEDIYTMGSPPERRAPFPGPRHQSNRCSDHAGIARPARYTELMIFALIAQYSESVMRPMVSISLA